ncbi:oligosaccharide flippase family protein [Propioniciclava soli]|uniref:Oligosaccharide flippase family protein n=1 Tax=Propioniciclava soli TaxID=2775081 RepID=A0ABZ3C8M5_9ACTN
MLKALSARGLTTLTSAVFGILAARLILGQAGPEYFALYGLITALPSLLQFQDLGSGAALVNAIATSPNHDREPVRRALLSVWRVTFTFATCLFVVNLLLLFSGGWRLLLGTAGTVEQGPLVVFLGLTLWGLTIPLGVWIRILLGLQKNHLTVLIQGVLAPLNLTILWLLIRTGDEAYPYLSLSAYAGGLAVAMLGLAFAARHLPGVLSWAALRLAQVRRQPGARVMDVGWPMLAQMLSAPLSLTAQRYVLAQNAPADDVAVYAAAFQVFVAFLGVISAAGVALWPRFARQRMQGTLTQGPYKFSALMAAGASAVCGAVWLVRDPLFAFTTNGALHVSGEIVAAFGLMVVLQAALYPLGMFIMDKPGIRFQVIPTLTMAVSSLILAILLTPSWGVVGPVLSNCFCVIVCQIIPFSVYIHRHRARLWVRA